MARSVGLVVSVLLSFSVAAATDSGSSSAEQQPTFNERWQWLAQAAPPGPKSAPSKPATKPQQKLPVSLEQALYLIRSTLLTLNDANRSGNYTVLRDLAAPSFQARNSAADLARIFADLRGRHFDLFAVALAAPQLAAPPHLEANGMLRLTGDFATRPQLIRFDLLFENVGGQWKLFGISVATPPAASPAPQAAAPKNH
jgi:hypothetical protein